MSTEAKNRKLLAIAGYIESLENPQDAEFLREVHAILCQARIVIDHFISEHHGVVARVVGSTTVGNTAAELSWYCRLPKDQP